MSGAGDKAATWVYKGVWGALVRWMRVPGEPPTLPVRNGDELVQFQPARGFLAYLKLWFWIACLAIDVLILGAWIGCFFINATLALWLAPAALIVAVAPDVVAYVAVHVRYDTTWYVMTKRSIRLRRGVWSINETTVTFENVQNVMVRQGPVQRAFGIANVIIETAGSSGSGAPGQHKSISNQAIIEGVADAQTLRDRVMARVRASRSAGLGDDRDGGRVGEPRWTAAHIEALRAIRDEARALRATA